MIPEEIKTAFEEAYKRNKKSVWAGVNQTIRKVHEKSAKVVVIAEDTEPKELITPLVQELKLKKIEYHFGTRNEIGKLVHCPRPSSAACIVK